MTTLPAHRPPAEPELPVLAVARLDHSGRVSARPLLAALAWPPGHRLDLDVVDSVVLIVSSAVGRHVVSARGMLALPAAMTQLCGIACGAPVVLAAYLSLGLVAVYPANMVARLVREFHGSLPGGSDVR